MFCVTFGRHDACDKRGVAGQAATLATIWNESIDIDAYWDAGIAVFAVWSVQQVAGATEAPSQGLGVDGTQAGVVWVHDQIACPSVRPVTAWVKVGLE